ncbi:NAD-dependent DNA ligase LigA [Vallitalea okinawensis]|uniref:NAD-dependent DNA ligase LigA n=1 Tax=Vallitalea okinawensis TaxID=2078660 RepID=UPI000CFBB90D|nr:NAD-dependent DNA ligase LigA [Vallitalea okinawensis]
MKDYNRIKELVKIINEANKAYYQANKEIMTNFEYDELYDELVKLEDESGIVLANSPTRKVGYEILSSLPKYKHEQRMLSLDKTKETSKLKSWLGSHEGILSWKLDGLTIVLTYENGELVRAVTRGNGEVGEVVTNNAKVFENIPLRIPFKESLMIRGEAVIKYSDFKRINEKLDPEEQYKNPRNLCSGTVRQLNNEITAGRSVNFFAFTVVQSIGKEFDDLKVNQLKWLNQLGFDTVEYEIVTSESVEEVVNGFADIIVDNDFASDGLVLTFNEIAYSESLGSTSKFPRHSIAYKWSDELKETNLREIKWNTSRTGLINPIAIFDPVELEGTTVSRASLHNVSILEALELGKGDTITVYKANMIIPQVGENLTKSGIDKLPENCPACGGDTEVKVINSVKELFCTNPNCSAKLLKAFSHFVGRDAMNIEGLSEATLDKFIDKEFIKNFGDLYRLEKYETEIIEMEGFGRKSYDNLMKSIEKSKTMELANFIYALGIQNVGLSNARLLCKNYKNDFNIIRQATVDELIEIEGYGGIIAASISNYFMNEHNEMIIDDLLNYIQFNVYEENTNEQKLEGKTFVITGSVEHFKNRKELKAKIEELGGKVTGSVSKNTDYLLNNDNESTSSKNKKAKELGVPIITEEDFLGII